MIKLPVLPNRVVPTMDLPSESNVQQSSAFTVAVDPDGIDLFDFGVRGALASKRKRDLGIGADRPLPAPWTLVIEPTMICNAHCNFCAFGDERERMRRTPNEQYRTGLPHDVVRHILAFASKNGTRGTFWSGGGEPLLWAHFDGALSQCASFSEVLVQTNGVLLDRFTDTAERMARFRAISVSVVGDSARLNDEIGMGAFEGISRNLRRMVERKRSDNVLVDINAKVIVTRENYLRLPEIVQHYQNIGVDSVSLRLAQDFGDAGDGEAPAARIELTSREKESLCEVIERAAYKHPSLFAFKRVLLTSERVQLPPTRSCYSATDGHIAYVVADGEVYIGTAEMVNRQCSIGNVLSAGFDEIWGGEKHLSVIAYMNELQRARRCPMHLCRHVKANRGVEDYLDGRTGVLDETAIMRNRGAFL